MLTFTNDFTLSLIPVEVITIAIAIIIWIIVARLQVKLNKKDFIASIAGGIGLTLLSALLISFKFDSGAGQARKFGWPHYFYIKWYDLENILTSSGWYLGPVFSYLISNIIFYSIIILLITVIIKKFTAKKTGRYHF